MKTVGVRHGNKVALKIIAENETDVAILSAFTDVNLEYRVGNSYSCDLHGVSEVLVLQYEKKLEDE